MIEISDLPKEPEAAIIELIDRMLTLVPMGNGTLQNLAKANPRNKDSLDVHAIAVKRIANRLQDEDVYPIVVAAMEFSDEQNFAHVRRSFQDALSTISLMRLDEHFLDEASVSEFDQVQLTSAEKQKITELLSEAKSLATNAEFLSERNKRRIIFHISKIEAELYKEVSGFSAFLAAAADISGMVKKYGEDAMPIAEAIQTSRTITERKVEGYAQIEKEDQPKRLPKPSDND